MNKHFRTLLLKSTGAEDSYEIDEIQELWGGYGRIFRCGLTGAPQKSVIVKHVQLPSGMGRTSGGSGLSHQRKVKSYRVEMEFYHNWASFCDDACRVPHCCASDWQGDEFIMVLEDLNEGGYPRRKGRVNWSEMKACISWLAAFHACFTGMKPEGLWSVGTYWHLDTRPDELRALSDGPLKNAARAIDRRLQSCRFKTVLHGDAKLENFCFSDDGLKAAAVDFQYTGGGCGMKDLAYFTGSCLQEEECEAMEADILNFYFDEFRKQLARRKRDIDADALEEEWRGMYRVAWADFHRFLKGWSPGRWDAGCYSERVVREVIEGLR